MPKQKHPLPILILSAFVAIGVAGYVFSNKNQNPIFEDLPQIATPPTKEEEIAPEPNKIPDLTYSSITLSTDKPGKEVSDAVGFANLDAVLSLNRIDQKHFQKGMTIVYPNRYDDLFALSSFPRNIPELANTPKIIFIAQGIQEFGAYEYGSLVRFGGISTGKKSTPTKNGLYHTNWKAKETISTVNDEWLLKWNFNIENLDGIGIHEYELPGYPASHSCIRFSASDAKWFYDWAKEWKLSLDEQNVLEKGTPVVVFGEYPYGQIAPWKKLAENPYEMTLTKEALLTEFDKFSDLTIRP